MARTSYSQSSTFMRCGKHWEWKYKEKMEPLMEGSSLYFGTAVDQAVMEMLEGKDNFLTVFSDRWYSTEKKKGKEKFYYQIYDSPDIIYSYNDFDEHVLSDEDIGSMQSWLDELKIGTGKDPIDYMKEVSGKKKSKYKSPTANELRYFNRVSWLSLKRKGELLISHFHKEFYPYVTKTVSTQQFATIKDSATGDMIMGALDFVATLNIKTLRDKGHDIPEDIPDEATVIVDLKTASRRYTTENIDLSEQLPLYLALSKGQYNTDLVGYAVLIKNLSKDSEAFCKDCGNKKSGRHKTCDAVVNKIRCGGEWVGATKVKPQLQVIIRRKNEDDMNKVLLDQGMVLAAMRNGIIWRNLDACSNWYGAKCPFYDACHNGSLNGLRRKY